MTKMYDNMTEPDFAILVGIGVNKNIDESSLDELSALCAACNITEAGRVIQNRKDIDVTWYVGKGKVDEIKQLAEQRRANVAVFDTELSGSKVRNLENALGIPVLDRSKVILDIFASRAQSAEGKLQVELAQLRYNLPRLIGSGGLMSKMKNSVGMRGPGEKKLELDKRKIKDEIAVLEQRLLKAGEGRSVNKKSAAKNNMPRVCLVGYTNSGKSTLMNTLAKAGTVAEDKLFATLDPKTVRVYLSAEDGRGMQILLTDTVGFIDRLPHEFIRAFESTLDEAREADLLLHVVDASNPDCNKQIEVVNGVLKSIGAHRVPLIQVFNKTDKIPDSGHNIPANCVMISALKNQGTDELRREILRFLIKE